MATYNQVAYGSKGNDVTELQKMLNQNGYNLQADGNFGKNTQAAVRDYQQKNGLAVDGIVGKNTWGKLTGGTTSSTSSTSSPSAPQKLSAADEALNLFKQQQANAPGAFQFAGQAQYDDIIKKIMNREEFSFDLNGDALYQQYKDKYIQQGKMAMMDTMGQAQAATGGYGNSYAQSVGQQAYQSHLQQLNDVVPELYQMAYDRYAQDGQDLYNQYALLGDQYEQAYGQYRDEVSDHNTKLGQLWDQYATERGFQYQTERDAIEDEWKQKEFDEAVRQFNEQMAFSKQQYSDSKSSSTTSKYTSTGSGSYPTANQGGVSKKPTTAVNFDGGSGSGSLYNSGNANNGNTNNGNAGGVSDSIKKKASSFSNNDDLANYLDGLTASGAISESQADALYAENKSPEKAALSKRSWTLVDDGGVNWLWGIDNNATVKDQYGNTYRLDKLVDALVAEGMKKSDAKEYVKQLQKRLGA